MPQPEDGPPAEFKQPLIDALFELYGAAGKPSYRQMSVDIKADDSLKHSMSHDTVAKVFAGTSALIKWQNIECLVRYLVRQAVVPLDETAEVRRLHGLWLPYSESANPARNRMSPQLLSPPPHPVARKTAPIRGGADQNLARQIGFPPRNPRFLGREAFLDALSSASGNGQPMVIVGGGGMGKTQLAIEFVHRHMTDYDLVWWVPAEVQSSAHASLILLGELLKLPDHHRRIEDRVRGVLDELEGGRRRWLLVYDNANPSDLIHSLMPSRGGQLLVTSRDMD
jgi:hypothetical protein